MGVSLFRTNSIIDGFVSGGMAYQSNNAVQADLMVDYLYDEDKLLDRPLTGSSPRGWGVSVDAALYWEAKSWLAADDRLRMTLLSRDLWRRIKWSRVPYTSVTVVNGEQLLDEQGNINGRPLLQGVESYRGTTQGAGLLDLQWGLFYEPNRPLISPRIPLSAIGFQTRLIDAGVLSRPQTFSQLFVDLQPVGGASAYRLGLGLEKPLLSFSYTLRQFSVGVTLDHLAFDESHAVQLHCQWMVGGFH